MNRRSDLKVVVFFVVLTVALTVMVIFIWEKTLRPPFFAWVDREYPGEANTQRRWDIKQRTEHVLISFTVDALVVTLLLRLVRRQRRRAHAQRSQSQRGARATDRSQCPAPGRLKHVVPHFFPDFVVFGRV